MILSVVQRTAIPAFYSEWFMNRLKEEYVLVRNPFNDQYLSKIPLTNQNIDAIIFLTKNFRPMLKHVDELIDRDIFFIVQHTITPYHDDIEQKVFNKKKIIETIKELRNRIGKNRIILRYDPIIITSRYTIDYHVKAFEKILSELHDSIHHVYISFLDLYDKVKMNMKDVDYIPFTTDLMRDVSVALVEVANRYGVEVETCAESIDLSDIGISHGRCIDASFIEELTGSELVMSKQTKHLEAKHRTICDCHKHIDIGEYNTCLYGCKYCYANTSLDEAKLKYSKHDPNSPLLIGSPDGYEIIERSKQDVKSYKVDSKQISLFNF